MPGLLAPSSSSAVDAQRQTIAALRQQLQASSLEWEAERVSTGCPALDQILPGNGFRRGSLVEWYAADPGSGANILALIAARQACQSTGKLIVVDRRRTFYPPAAVAWGLSLQNMIVLAPRNDRDAAWAFDQAMRCTGVSAVLAWPEQIEGTTFRRLQLAAETSGVLGLFVRPAAAQHEPSWAETRCCVSPRASRAGWRLHVQVIHNRLQGHRHGIELEIDPHTGQIGRANHCTLASQLADSTPGGHAA